MPDHYMPDIYVLHDTMDAHRNKFPAQLILLAHGSRDPRWCENFEQGLTVINRHLDRPACLAYFEMASPSLESVIGEIILQGHSSIEILPLFFAEGRHLLQDIPKIISALQQDNKGITIRLLDAVGNHKIFWEALGIMISAQHKHHTDNFGETASEQN